MDSKVSREGLITYLNDHLAGSVAALELLDHLIRLQQGAEGEHALAAVRAEVQEDQETLQNLLGDIGGKESRVRKAAAWLTEKLGQAKLRLDDPGGGELRMLEALEALALGIQGKAALWRALAAASVQVSAVRHLDFATLEKRAQNQFQRVDSLRLQAAPAALSL
jgi:hypothetical protein